MERYDGAGHGTGGTAHAGVRMVVANGSMNGAALYLAVRYNDGMTKSLVTPESPARLTRQRQAVLTAVAGRWDHPTAAQVFDAVRGQQPHIAYGTVYNALHYLADAGLVAEVRRPDGVVSYDRETTPHDHAVCRACGTLADVHLPTVRDTVATAYGAVAGETGFAIEGHRVEFVGLCPACQTSD